MKVIALGQDDAEAIEQLAEVHYPPEFHLDMEDVAKNLRQADEVGFNFSFGLETKGALMGYLLAWLDNSRLEGRREDVVLIDDLVVVPEARVHLKKLLSALAEELNSKELGDLAVEAAIRAQDAGFLQLHTRFLESLGYELVAEVPYDDEDLGEGLTWVRFEPWSQKEDIEVPDDFFDTVKEESTSAEPVEEEEFGDFEEELH